MKNEGCNSTICSIVYFLLGGLVGAAVAILTTPKTGKETRQQITDLAEDVKDKVGDYYEDVKDSVSSALKHGKGSIEERKQLIIDAVAQAHREANERIEDLIHQKV